MKINRVDLADGGRVLLIDNFLEPQWLEHTRNICNEFQANQGR